MEANGTITYRSKLMTKVKTSKVKERRRGRPVKNELAKPIDDTPENVMRVVLKAKPKATDFWYVRKTKKRPR